MVGERERGEGGGAAVVVVVAVASSSIYESLSLLFLLLTVFRHYEALPAALQDPRHYTTTHTTSTVVASLAWPWMDAEGRGGASSRVGVTCRLLSERWSHQLEAPAHATSTLVPRFL